MKKGTHRKSTWHSEPNDPGCANCIQEPTTDVVFPMLACSHCGYHNQLNFNPLKDYTRLLLVVCFSCKLVAYAAPNQEDRRRISTHSAVFIGHLVAPLKDILGSYKDILGS